jgi:hypothetical protein
MWENTSDGRAIYTYDDGSQVGYTVQNPSDVWSRDIGSTQWVNDPSPAPAGLNVFARDAVEQQRMQQAYPQNGQPWDWNAATLGIARLLDSGARAYATANGTYPATYAGQNGATFVAGSTRNGFYANAGGIMPFLLIGGALLLLMK